MLESKIRGIKVTASPTASADPTLPTMERAIITPVQAASSCFEAVAITANRTAEFPGMDLSVTGLLSSIEQSDH